MGEVILCFNLDYLKRKIMLKPNSLYIKVKVKLKELQKFFSAIPARTFVDKEWYNGQHWWSKDGLKAPQE